MAIDLLDEHHYAAAYQNKLVPTLQSVCQTGYFPGVKRQRLYYETFRHPKVARGSMVILHGFSGDITRFLELIYYFFTLGFDVYVFEMRGHGHSGRLGSDAAQIHVDSFDDYVADLQTFITKIVTPQVRTPLYLYGHSMGGAVGALYLIQDHHTFKKAILSAPMFESRFHGQILKLLVKSGQKLLGPTHYYFRGGDLEKSKYLNHPQTHAKARMAYYTYLQSQDAALCTGDGSFGWLLAADAAMTKIKKNARKISTPTLIIEAGQDLLVTSRAHRQVARRAKNMTVRRINKSFHNLYQETNRILTIYLYLIDNFLR